MKNTVTVDSITFRQALEVAVVVNKSTIPTLEYVHIAFESDDALVTVRGTDLELFTVTELRGKGSESFEFLLPRRKALECLKGETDDLVITSSVESETVKYKHQEHGLYVDGKWTPGAEVEKEKIVVTALLSLSVGGIEYSFDSLDKEHFPKLPEIEGVDFSIPAGELKTIFARTSFAISSEKSRYTLNGALLQTGKNTLRVCTTDGHRLALHESEMQAETSQTIIPSDAIDWLSPKLKTGSVSVIVGKEFTAFNVRSINTVLIARKITGQFPNYEAVMPKEFNTFASFPQAEDALKILGKVAKAADERSGCVKWAVNGRVEISAQSDGRKAFTTLPASSSGDLVTIGLSAPYVMEFLKTAGKNSATLSLKDSQSAGLWRSEEMPGYSYIVMPMRF